MKQTFEQWSRKVDNAVNAICGMSTYDLPDCDYWTWYDEGVSPSTAANRAIKEAGGY